MKELTDIEICQRIAEIEGIVTGITLHRVVELIPVGTRGATTSRHYNPLLDNALCFKLMLKYKISVEVQHVLGDDLEDLMYYVHIDCQHAILRDDIRLAICLCIIEAHQS